MKPVVLLSEPETRPDLKWVEEVAALLPEESRLGWYQNVRPWLRMLPPDDEVAHLAYSMGYLALLTRTTPALVAAERVRLTATLERVSTEMAAAVKTTADYHQRPIEPVAGRDRPGTAPRCSCRPDCGLSTRAVFELRSARDGATTSGASRQSSAANDPARGCSHRLPSTVERIPKPSDGCAQQREGQRGRSKGINRPLEQRNAPGAVDVPGAGFASRPAYGRAVLLVDG